MNYTFYSTRVASKTKTIFIVCAIRICTLLLRLVQTQQKKPMCFERHVKTISFVLIEKDCVQRKKAKTMLWNLE